MRITNSMLVSNFMNNLNTNLNKMSKLQYQLATNRKFAHVSDDPVSAIYSMQARNKLNRLKHYNSNVSMAQSWLTQSEAGVLELNDIVKKAYEACIDAATDVKSDGDKSNASEYIGQLRDQIVTSLNSAFGDKYVFGDYNTPGYVDANGKTVPPFTVEKETVDVFDEAGNQIFVKNPNYDDTDPLSEEYIPLQREKSYLCYNNQRIDQMTDAEKQAILDKGIEFDVGPGIPMPVSVNGLELVLFGSATVKGYNVEGTDGAPDQYYSHPYHGEYTDLFSLLDGLYQVANEKDFEMFTQNAPNDFSQVQKGSDAEFINAFIPGLQSAQSHLLSIDAELGGRTNRLEILASRYEQDEINYTQMKSDAEDADQAEIIMNYKMAEAVYKAALSSGASIIQPTLMDFLR